MGGGAGAGVGATGAGAVGGLGLGGALGGAGGGGELPWLACGVASLLLGDPPSVAVAFAWFVVVGAAGVFVELAL